jgi:glutamine synthetase
VFLNGQDADQRHTFCVQFNQHCMNIQELRGQIRAGSIDTVIVAFPDPFGRLVGKRFRGDIFLDSVLKHGTHGCNYLLTVNMEMDPLDGFKVASWDAGFGDFAFRPDTDTLRVLPWQPGAALVLCDYVRENGSLVAEAPRSVLRKQLDQLKQQGLTCFCASELEFYLFNQTYHAAFQSAYQNLQPSSDYRIDYHIMQPTRDEPLMRIIRNSMTAARIPIESSKGEWSRGQHEINFTYTEPLPMADMHVLFKQGIKEIADQNGKAISFMAKYAPSEAGNSCHIHISLWKNGRNLFWDAAGKPSGKQSAKHHGAPQNRSKLFRQFLGGLIKYSPELCLFFGPTINSYKRYQPGSWAPTRMAWAVDNRTVGFRVVGEKNSLRIENRMPGADANPYLAFAAMIAAGMAGISQQLDCGQEYSGNAYVDPKLARLPASLEDAANLFERSNLARAAFGDEVAQFYVHHARLEIEAFNNAVTDWEKMRYFERI